MRPNEKSYRVGVYGHFGRNNFGNEITLHAFIYHLRRRLPQAEITCICTGPGVTAVAYNVKAVPISRSYKQIWPVRHVVLRVLKAGCIGLLREIWRCLKAVALLSKIDALIIPGTGLLTDAYGLAPFSWGPYNIFKWALISKCCRCRLLFVSVGAGPLYTKFGKYFVKVALALADFRSYRDRSTVECIRAIGFDSSDDRMYPDLAFSVPCGAMPCVPAKSKQRIVVGLGLMQYPGKYSVEHPEADAYTKYLLTLAAFVKWLLAHDYDIRLLIGDLDDAGIGEVFTSLLAQQSITYEQGRVVDEPVTSFQHLLVQIATTDFVVATRFHNVLFAMLLARPVVSLSFHHKCSSLMRQMELNDYCIDIHTLEVNTLIERFSALERDADKIKGIIQNGAEVNREALNQQYDMLFRENGTL